MEGECTLNIPTEVTGHFAVKVQVPFLDQVHHDLANHLGANNQISIGSLKGKGQKVKFKCKNKFYSKRSSITHFFFAYVISVVFSDIISKV